MCAPSLEPTGGECGGVEGGWVCVCARKGSGLPAFGGVVKRYVGVPDAGRLPDLCGLGADGDATGTVKVNNDTTIDLRKDKLVGFVPQDDIVRAQHTAICTSPALLALTPNLTFTWPQVHPSWPYSPNPTPNPDPTQPGAPRADRLRDPLLQRHDPPARRYARRDQEGPRAACHQGAPPVYRTCHMCMCM